MRTFFTLFAVLLTSLVFAQRGGFEQWHTESEQNMRLLPEFGNKAKNAEQLQSDAAFIEDVMTSFDNVRSASDKMVGLGFQYLYKGDLRTAMYRFNQAFLLDSTNANSYWGYGAVYMAFGKYDLAREQYSRGLEKEPQSDDILIDFGTSYLGDYYDAIGKDELRASEALDMAEEKLKEAYAVNPDNPNASYKLSIVYLYQNNCILAQEFLKISDTLGNGNITADYRRDLAARCAQEPKDCDSVRTGKFMSYDPKIGETIIERSAEFQVETNEKYGYKYKLEVTWLNECTYQLRPVADLLNPDKKELPTMVLTCRIVAITETGYIQVSSSDQDGMEMTTELVRVE